MYRFVAFILCLMLFSVSASAQDDLVIPDSSLAYNVSVVIDGKNEKGLEESKDYWVAEIGDRKILLENCFSYVVMGSPWYKKVCGVFLREGVNSLGIYYYRYRKITDTVLFDRIFKELKEKYPNKYFRRD